MNNPVRVEIVPRTVEADDETRAHRAQTVQRLAELGQLDNPESGQIGQTMQDGWVARINGAEVPVAVFAVEQDEGGQPVLLLQLRPDSLTIDRQSPAAARSVAPQVSGWNTPVSLGEQVARGAEALA